MVVRRAGRGWCSRAAPLSHSSVGLGLVGHLVTEIHATHARLSTVLLKPPPTHPKVANTGPWLAGTAMEVAAWLGLLGVPSGDEDKQHDIIRNKKNQVEQLTDSLTSADPAEVAVPESEIRDRRSARGRARPCSNFLVF